MDEPEPTRVDRALRRAKDSRWMAPAIVAGVIVVALAGFTEATGKLFTAVRGWWSDEPIEASEARPSDEGAGLRFEVERVAGTVRAPSGARLGGVDVDLPGVGSDRTDAEGRFELRIGRPLSNARLRLRHPGYRDLDLPVVPEETEFLEAELEPVALTAESLLFVEGELVVGHHVGLPQVDVPLRLANPTPDTVVVSAPTLALSGPEGSRLLLHPKALYPAPGMGMVPPLPVITLEPAGGASSSFAMLWVHTVLDPTAGDLSARLDAAVAGNARFRAAGPSLAHPVLDEELTAEVRQHLEDEFIWTPGAWTAEWSVAVGGRRFTVARTFELSEAQVSGMLAISEYYNRGFGLAFGAHLNPVGDARPGLHVVGVGD